MKRMSLTAAALLAGLATGFSGPAYAVNPPKTTPDANTNYFNPSTLPGQGYYYGNLGNTSDPFFNPGSYSPLPTTPQTPTSTVIPNPTGPSDQVRSRVSSPVAPQYMPPGSTTPPVNNQRKWRLGVYSKDTDTGVKIHDIVPNSAAQRAGLEVNDTIISVNGYQVGYVNGQLYDCGTEFDRLADENGWVTLLVQNNRNNQLLNVPVQLDSRLSTLTGSIAFQNRQNLPNDAVVNVELKEVIGSNNAATFASTQVQSVNKYPIPFRIDYDPAHIASNGRYVVSASVVSNGRELYRTTSPYQVVSQNGQIRPVALQLQPVQSNPYPNQPTQPADQNAQIAQIVRWFNDYLGRDPSDRELVTWLEALHQGQSLAQVQLTLLANDQFFNRCDADKRVYIERMHELLVGRKPTPAEFNYWLARYDAQGGIRRELAKEFQGALGIY